MTYILIALGCYLIGSIPSAFLLVRRQAGVDIRSAGSGNVGGFNAYTVTNSRWIGIAVGVLDAVKGVAAVLLVGWLTEWNFWMQSTGLLCALVGHNYPVWLKFKGGRGLATAAGGSLLLGVPGFLLWCAIWVIVYKITQDILRGNIAAILLTPPILYAVPDAWLAAVLPGRIVPIEYVTMMCFVSIVHLFRHLDVVKDIARGSRPTDH